MEPSKDDIKVEIPDNKYSIEKLEEENSNEEKDIAKTGPFGEEKTKKKKGSGISNNIAEIIIF